MRRVVVTGMGVVSSIGNNTQEVLASLREAKSGHRAGGEVRGAGLPLPGARRAAARVGEHGAAQGEALHGGGRRLELHRHGPGDPRRRPRAHRRRQRAHRHHHGRRRPLDPRHRARGRRDAREGPEEGRPLRGAQGHVLGSLRRAGDRASRSRAPTIPSRRPAPPRRTASATRQSSSSGASRTSCSPAAARSSTGRCRCCSTPWAPCPRTSTTRPPRPAGPTTRPATAS